jgi:hypothetical protein
VLCHLYHVHQAAPLTDSLFVVTNRANHAEYAGTAAFFDTFGRFPKEWQQRRILCNGASRPEEWGGHVEDVKMALRKMEEEGVCRDVLVIDGNCFFWPRFPLQARCLRSTIVFFAWMDDREVVAACYGSQTSRLPRRAERDVLVVDGDP